MSHPNLQKNNDLTRPAQPLPAAALRGPLDNLEEHFVRTDHAELEPRPFLDRLEPLLQVPHLRIERIVSRLQRLIPRLLARQLAIDVPCPHPAALPEPERIL